MTRLTRFKKFEQTLKLEGLVGLSDTDTQNTKLKMHKCVLSGLINLNGLAAAMFDMDQTNVNCLVGISIRQLIITSECA